MKPVFSFLLVLIAAAACSPKEEPGPGSAGPVTDTLVVRDTIGVLMGDSCYVFGMISSAEALPGGGIVLLDRRTGLISEFDSSGDFVTSFGGLGEAPGEFNYPGIMTVLGDGRIAAMDWMDMEVCFFAEDGSYLLSRPNRGSEMPLSMSALGDSSFVTYSCPTRRIEDTWKMGYELSIWEGTSAEPSAVPFSHLFDFGQEDYDFRPGYLAVAGGPDGRVYMHRMDSARYLIEVIDESGSIVDSILGQDVHTTWDQMERYPSLPAVTFAVQIDDQRDQVSGEMTDCPPQVENLGVDSLGNIWARRGNSDGFIWDVFSPRGELVRHVVLPTLPDTAMVRVNVTRNGIVAWDLAPEDYPKVYLLAFRE